MNYVKKNILLILFLILLVTHINVNCQNDDEKLLALVKDYYKAWNSDNYESFIDQNFSESYVRHEGRAEKGDYKGKAELKNYINTIHKAYSDWKVEAKEMYVVGNKVFSVWRSTGTNDGNWGELKPTGKSISIDGFLITQIEKGKIIEEWSFWNEGKLWIQLGFQLIPPSE